MSHSSETLNRGDHGNPRLYSQLVRRAGGLGAPAGVAAVLSEDSFFLELALL